MKMKYFLLIYLLLVLLSPAPVYANTEDIKNQIFYKNDYFCITEINIDIDEYGNSQIEFNLIQNNESDNIQLQTPYILPEYIPFRIQESEITQKTSEIIGGKSNRGDIIIDIDIPVKQYKLTCGNCIYKLNEKPFDSYLFIFPFIFLKDYRPINGNIFDAIYVEIPENYEFKKVGQDKIVGGGLMKKKTDYEVLPNDLRISEFPDDAFGLKINGKRIDRIGFDAEDHLILFVYGRPLWEMVLALLLPLLSFIFYILVKLFLFKEKNVSEIFYIFCGMILAIRYFFIGIYKPVIWDLELLIFIILAMFITLREKRE